MRKYIFTLLGVLLLTACANEQIDLGKPAQLPEPPSPQQTTLGFDDNGEVSYACVQSEVAPALVWVTCHFHNFAPEAKGMCIKVAYNKNGSPVAESRAFCSGTLAMGETKPNYAAFTPKHGREALEDHCGINMTLCTMSAKEIK